MVDVFILKLPLSPVHTERQRQRLESVIDTFASDAAAAWREWYKYKSTESLLRLPLGVNRPLPKAALSLSYTSGSFDSFFIASILSSGIFIPSTL